MLDRFPTLIRWVSGNRRISVFSIGLLSLCGAVAVALATGISRPGVADEFSYLLAADTYAHLRLTNPAHLLWKHFEAFWVLQQPTYSAKYPPAQGIALAFGQVLGHPIIGVWLSAAALCATITWMLRAWVPSRWAYLGGLLVALKFGISGVWAQSYMGGAVAAIGGALLFGGLRRVLSKGRVRDALWMGAGLVILANSRPYEGLLLSLPVAALLLSWLTRQRGHILRRSFSKVVLPIACCLALGAGWTLAHNRAVTGSALKLPHELYMKTYPIHYTFVWQKVPAAPKYRHAIMQRFQRRHRSNLMESNPPGIKWRAIKKRFKKLRYTFLPGHLWLPLALLPFALKNRWTLFALGCCLFMLAGQLLTVPLMAYSSAPATALLFLLIVESIRTTKYSRLTTKSLTSPVVAVVLGLFLWNSVAQARQDNGARWTAIHRIRPQIEADLKSGGGEHVIFVRYGPHHNPHNEWVYNSADIDSQEVVWSQDRGDALNQQITSYFPGRQFWVIELGFTRGEATEVRPKRYSPIADPEISFEELTEVLAWTAESRNSEGRNILLQSILNGKTAGARVLQPGVWLAGTHADYSTRGTQPAVIAIRNDGLEALTPILRLACHAPPGEFPVTLHVDDGQRVRTRVFTRRGVRNLRMSPIPPGKASLFVLSVDKAWHPGGTGRRLLGVRVLEVRLEAVK